MSEEAMIEARCMERVRAHRWSGGLRCPRCGDVRCAVHASGGEAGRRKLYCRGCGRTFTDLTGTPLARSHVPLRKWFAGARLMTSLGREPTCAELGRRLGVKLATAWRMRNILRRALADPALAAAFAEEGS